MGLHYDVKLLTIIFLELFYSNVKVYKVNRNAHKYILSHYNTNNAEQRARQTGNA